MYLYLILNGIIIIIIIKLLILLQETHSDKRNYLLYAYLCLFGIDEICKSHSCTQLSIGAKTSNSNID
jgi:hypothetical protein